jgi:MarR family transcriptional regulator, organic hydroperoxide resistance regulator
MEAPANAIGADADTPTDTEDIVDLFFGVIGRFREHFLSRLAEFDLTGPQAHALRQLSAPLSQRQLATCLGYDASNITAIVDGLEERHLVERHIDPTDRRVKRLVVTDAGHDLMARLRDRVLDGVPLVDNLDADGRRQFRDLLAKVAGGAPSPGWLVGTGRQHTAVP